MSSHPLILDRVRIAATGSFTPAKVLTNQEIVDSGVATTDDWVRLNLGVSQRNIAGPDEWTSDLAAAAGAAAIRMAGLESDDIEAVILATSTPDRLAPATACLVQAKLGITNRGPAFDVSAVCSGFLYAMTVGAQFIQTSMYNRVLVIGADTFSKITDWDRRDCVFFGDGAGAVVLERTEGGCFSALLRAEGTGMDNFTVFPGETTFTMNARAVYDTATTVLPECIRELLEISGRQPGDLKAIIPHQPSVRVLRKTAEVLGIPFEVIRTNLACHANTAGATVPLLLDQVHRAEPFRPGDLVLFAAVGAGWTWGAVLYEWK